MGGGRSNAPPPSRRWNIQRPSRARVNSKESHQVKKNKSQSNLDLEGNIVVRYLEMNR